MSVKGDMLRMGLDSDGSNVEAFQGSITANTTVNAGTSVNATTFVKGVTGLIGGAFSIASLAAIGMGGKAVTLANDGTLEFNDATAALIAVAEEGGAEFGVVMVSADGTIVEVAGSTNFQITDPGEDDVLAIIPDGTTATTAKLVNALDAEKTINVFYFTIGGE